MLRVCLILISITLSGCAARTATHNFPDTSPPNQLLTARHYEVWVDADATFFPNGWEALCGSYRSGAYTLHNRALSLNYLDCTPELLSQIREQTLSEIAEAFSGLEMVTILIHGFNHGVSNQATSIRNDYLARRNAIDGILADPSNRPIEHGYIEFFWNGLESTRGNLGIPAAWTYASINGERAGHLALQPILATLQDAGVQRVHILAHSRGAAVALSALAGGKYVDEAGRARNAALGAPTPPRPLADGGMEILVTSTAPAISCWHFVSREERRIRCDDPVRELPASVISHYSTVNPSDFALRKLIGGILVTRLNSTEFGQNLRAAQGVADRMNEARMGAGGSAFMAVENIDMVNDQIEGGPADGVSSHSATDYLNLRQVRARLQEVYAPPD
ncbi:hypothetical protein L2D01_01665 [Hyphomonadaceae bacterium ML37]|nr:hypothetical protein L2D01_01665 [Hyphomonadaceae bacterium ML37]